MKNIKSIIFLVIMLIVTIIVSGCGNKNIEGSLEDIMTKVYANIPDEEKPMMLMNTEVNSENIEYYLGSTDIKYQEALASESGVGSIAHSVVLLRAEDNADINKIKEEIKEKVNPRKWICVGVEKEDLIIKNKGNLIILIMVEDTNTRSKLEANFDKLK